MATRQIERRGPTAGPRAGFSLPIAWFFLIFVVLVTTLVWVYGWKGLVYLAGFLAVVAALVWIYLVPLHALTCQRCATARRYVRDRYPDLEARTSLRSHRARKGEYVVIAVFVGPLRGSDATGRYKLVKVSYSLSEVSEVSAEEADELLFEKPPEGPSPSVP